jgi:iron uptake system component EfeO
MEAARPGRATAVAVALGLTLALGTACSSGSATSSARAATIEITLSDAGCEPRSIAAKAGPTTFKVVNEGSLEVTEFEVLQRGRILGEVENVSAGARRTFSLTLAAGSYVTKCPGGAGFDTGTLEVADEPRGAAADSAARDAAVTRYVAYVKREADALITAVTPFADAVRRGDVTAGRQTFASARTHYETIEPIAESFGDLDPAIDAREGDVPAAEWGGFHRIEKALWTTNDLTGMAPVADKLVADIARLRTLVDTVELEPSQIANGAVELLNEVSVSKITGEEDRYSHTDLSDFAANLAGSRAAFEAVEPLVAADEATLAGQIQERFTAVQAALDEHRADGPIGNGFALFDTLGPADSRVLSTTLDTLAEPLSRVAALVL